MREAHENPPSKTEKLCNTSARFCLRSGVQMNNMALPSQDEVGVETDEDCKVVVPST